jgi:integrase
VGRDRVRAHHGDRDPVSAGPDDSAVRESGRRLWAASVTLHGLRHGAATLALAAGTDLKVVQDQLGHSTIALTADTYTNSQELH